MKEIRATPYLTRKITSFLTVQLHYSHNYMFKWPLFDVKQEGIKIKDKLQSLFKTCKNLHNFNSINDSHL